MNAPVTFVPDGIGPLQLGIVIVLVIVCDHVKKNIQNPGSSSYPG